MTDETTTNNDDIEEEEEEDEDVGHKSPYDRTMIPTWFLEDARRHGNVLTQDGIAQIAFHQYKAGAYTHLDEILNPFWTWATEFLPMSMAPNLVTTCGGFFCLCSYMATWYYLPQFQERQQLVEGDDNAEPSLEWLPVPKMLLVMNGLAIILYYTLDCMDGKQARRTGSSSPLGQLFDHGVDCFSNLCHLSIAQSFLQFGPSKFYLASQLGLQFAFFAPQWEEYYTGTLPHSYGKWLGVSEVNYGLAVISIANACIDFKWFYNRTLQQTLMPILPISILPFNPKEPDLFVSTLNACLTCKLKHVILYAWVALSTSIVFGCIVRTAKHIKEPLPMLVALSKFFSPLLIAITILYVTPDEVVQQDCRLISIASGLCLCFITLKMIVLSMGRMVYASFQKDVVPLAVILGFITYEVDYADVRRLQPKGVEFLLQVLVVYYLARIMHWTSRATSQLCEKLDVYLFRIKPKQA